MAEPSGTRSGRGRDGSYLPPPAQIRTCGTTAYGSFLRYVTRSVLLGRDERFWAVVRVDSIGLKIRRVSSIRTAFIHAEWEAGRLLRQRYADLDISSVLNDLMDAVSQMAMIVAGSVLTGATLGAGFGAFFGGVGAVPLGVAGAAMGLQVSTWILGVLGLESIAEYFVDGLPKIAEHYVRGIKAAWNGPRGETGLSPFIQDDPYAQRSATHHIALGHVEVVTLPCFWGLSSPTSREAEGTRQYSRRKCEPAPRARVWVSGCSSMRTS